MKIEIHSDAAQATAAAAEHLACCLTEPGARTLMVAGGNSPLQLYQAIAERRLSLTHLHIFALDEYVGVPASEPRTTANLLRRVVAEAWSIPAPQYHAVSSEEREALASVQPHERKLAALGGLDVLVLGLGVNCHLGFNEPGSAPDSVGRIVDLEATSTEANRAWFNGDYAPARGVTVGLKTILAARKILILAYGKSKAVPAQRMIEGPQGVVCPAAWLQSHPDTRAYLDEAAARLLSARGASHSE
ncbi:MAG: 6-phosphogluconolactonase [Verrucomicrobia bacterium]|nr:6-phosphogluconolactonase [Verrucomicrobiota bacterium]